MSGSHEIQQKLKGHDGLILAALWADATGPQSRYYYAMLIFFGQALCSTSTSSDYSMILLLSSLLRNAKHACYIACNRSMVVLRLHDYTVLIEVCMANTSLNTNSITSQPLPETGVQHKCIVICTYIHLSNTYLQTQLQHLSL